MDLSYGTEYESFRAEVREFLAGWPLRGEEAALPAAERERLFRNRGVERGYVYRHIPVEYGGSGRPPHPIQEAIIREEYAVAGAPGDRLEQGSGMLAPTLIEWGTEEQKRHFVPPTLRGEIRWCQGYSEPGSGSDLASLKSQAVLQGGEWILNGQKIWTSNADRADWMFGLFRSEPDAPKHAGISYLLVPMKQPGITVRPLKQLTGSLEFNEVFFDDARTPADHIVGRRGEGWQVSRSTLKHERGLIGSPRLMRSLFDELVALARRTQRGDRPAIEDAHVRKRLAEIEGYVRAGEATSLRMLSARFQGQEHKVVLPMLMAKLFSTDVAQMVAKAAYDLVGSEGLLAPPQAEAYYDASGTGPGFTHNFLATLGPAIAGGASNIQRNIIGERGLGLPRDLRASR
jgi:alkylation response protein AidB-like acyl-CoA dehydrogenase